MSLPPQLQPPVRDPGPPTLPALPALTTPAWNEFTSVEKQGCDRALVRIGDKLHILTRAECFHLIGKLERVAVTL